MNLAGVILLSRVERGLGQRGQKQKSGSSLHLGGLEERETDAMGEDEGEGDRSCARRLSGRLGAYLYQWQSIAPSLAPPSLSSCLLLMGGMLRILSPIC